MKTKGQFQNFVWQRTATQDNTQLPTIILPSISSSTQGERLVPATPTIPATPGPEAPTLVDLPESVEQSTPISRKKKLLRGFSLALCFCLLLTLYVTWRSVNASTSSPVSVQQPDGKASPVPNTDSGEASTPDTGTIQVYILGAVVHPGVYTLPADARVYQLVQMAGGLLPNANLVALNMAAKLSDGEEIYVLHVGETTPPGINAPAGSDNNSTPGQRVNINTATEAELVQNLHVSATTAKKIVDYRTQHGPYTAVEQLLQVISQSIYTRIKDMVTV